MEPNEVSRMGDEEAARWFACLRAPGCPPIVQREFHRWLESHPDHPAAYERAMLAAQRVTRAVYADPELQAMLDEALAEKAAAPVQRAGWLQRWRMQPLGAAALSLLCVLVLSQSWRDSPLEQPATQTLVNESNARREIALADGSSVLLDVNSRIEVQMYPDSRRLRLLSGRAIFQVAHDKLRPFTVEAGDTRTTALGTQFEVDVRGGLTSVTLAEGSVAVTDRSGQGAWSRRLSPGQQLLSRERREPELRSVDLQHSLGWSSGQLHFDSATLAEVVTEWNRYSSVRVTLGDTSLAESRIVGTFPAGGNCNEFVGALASVLPIRVVRVGAEEILLVRHY